MIELLMLHFVLQIFRTNIPSNTLPWNTTASPNPLNIPNLITQNIPWFWPLIALVLLLGTDYELGLKKGVDSKENFFAVAVAYTIFNYVLVAGSLEVSGYFYIFEFIMLASLFIMTLFVKASEGG